MRTRALVSWRLDEHVPRPDFGFSSIQQLGGSLFVLPILRAGLDDVVAAAGDIRAAPVDIVAALPGHLGGALQVDPRLTPGLTPG